MIVPLVRRPRQSLPPEKNPAPPSVLPPSLAPRSQRPSGLLPAARPEASELADVPPSRAPLQMVVDFGALTRKARDEQAPATQRGAPPDPAARSYEPRMPPFPSLTPILEAIDSAPERDTLVAAIVRGIGTSARAAVLLAPRRGRFMGIGASYDLADVVRGATVPTSPLIDEAIAEASCSASRDVRSPTASSASCSASRTTTSRRCSCTWPTSRASRPSCWSPSAWATRPRPRVAVASSPPPRAAR
ncbi:MAG: hypothetical protein IPJ34_43470 [Myxococcales bacterium]|nr:hypothetical protein [Myxococcales bacterium]